MHEMGIANSILEAVAREMRAPSGRASYKVGVRIGELAAVDAESLRFCFEALGSRHGARRVAAGDRTLSAPCIAAVTAADFVVRTTTLHVRTARYVGDECISGDELELAYVEVEENEPSAVGTKSS